MNNNGNKTLKGKKFWQNKTALAYEFENKFKEIYKDKINFTPVNLQTIVSYLPNESFNLLKEMYISSVVEEKVEDNVSKEIDRLCEKDASDNYLSMDPAPTVPFYELPKDQRQELIDNEKKNFNETRRKEIEEEKKNQATKIAELTVERILKLAQDNKIKLGKDGKPITTPTAILFNITESYPQETYLADSEYAKWLSSYYDAEIPKKSDGSIDRDALENIEIEVYCFQCGDLGANNFMKFGDNGGNIGAKDGMFVITKKDYDELLKDSTIFDSEGKCTSIPKLSARLGNVPLGVNPICVKQTVKLSQLETSHGGKSTAYFGEFGPPLSTQGGYDQNGNYIEGKPEAIVPQTNFIVNGQINPNIEIISHSKNITTDELMNFAQMYLSKSEQFRGRDDISMDHWGLTDNLDKDIELLKKFKETLTKEEQQYLSQLMVHLQTAMQREEVASVGMGAK